MATLGDTAHVPTVYSTELQTQVHLPLLTLLTMILPSSDFQSLQWPHRLCDVSVPALTRAKIAMPPPEAMLLQVRLITSQCRVFRIRPESFCSQHNNTYSRSGCRTSSQVQYLVMSALPWELGCKSLPLRPRCAWYHNPIPPSCTLVRTQSALTIRWNGVKYCSSTTGQGLKEINLLRLSPEFLF